MNKTKLLFDLIMYVNAKRIFTAQDVSNEFRVSLRTAHRYLSELSEMGIPLYTEPGRNGGFRILDNRSLPPIIFNESEAFSIFFAFKSLKYYNSLPFEIDIESVSRKIYVGLPGDTRNKIDNLDTVLSFWNKKRTIPSPFIKEIIEASLDSQILYIKYKSKAEDTDREIVPVGVYAYDGFWYMPALDIKLNEIRLFRLDRILALENTHKKYSSTMSLDGWLKNPITEATGELARLYVELTREGMRQCSSHPWLEPYINIADEEQGFIDMEIDKSELPFISSFFLQLGTNAKVIEPKEVINNIRRELEATLLHYS